MYRVTIFRRMGHRVRKCLMQIRGTEREAVKVADGIIANDSSVFAYRVVRES